MIDRQSRLPVLLLAARGSCAYETRTGVKFTVGGTLTINCPIPGSLYKEVEDVQFQPIGRHKAIWQLVGSIAKYGAFSLVDYYSDLEKRATGKRLGGLFHVHLTRSKYAGEAT